MTPKQLHILQHALGVDKHGLGEHYRNYYIGECPIADELVALGSVSYTHLFSLTLESLKRYQRNHGADNHSVPCWACCTGGDGLTVPVWPRTAGNGLESRGIVGLCSFVKNWRDKDLQAIV